MVWFWIDLQVRFFCREFLLEGLGGLNPKTAHLSYQSTEDTEICELEARALRAEAEVLGVEMDILHLKHVMLKTQ